MALSETPATVGRVSPWVKALVLIHVAGIVAWALPRPRAEIVQGTAAPIGSDYLLVWGNQLRQVGPVSGYVQATGSWQYWDMFAPDPAQMDQWADAEVERRDGTRVVVGYPRIFEMGIGAKFLNERYRKFYERAGSRDCAYLWPTFAIQMARQIPRDPQNPPVAVTLRRHYLHILPPGQPQPTEYSIESYYTYYLRPGDVEKGQLR